jgi:hypothetical protein
MLLNLTPSSGLQVSRMRIFMIVWSSEFSLSIILSTTASTALLNVPAEVKVPEKLNDLYGIVSANC